MSPTGTTAGITEPATIPINKAVEVILAAPLEIPIMIWGDTGIGKTQIVEALAEQLEQKAMTTIAQITSTVDWTGVPHLETVGGVKYTRFSIPRHLPNPEVDGENGIYFFDELPNAPKSVQAAIQSLLTRGEYNGYIWPRGWKQIAAGNRATDKANTYEMPRPVKNRMMHLHVGYDPEAWLSWAAGAEETAVRTPDKKFPSIKAIRKEGDARIHALVRAFIHVNPRLFHAEDELSEAFATPRTWEYTSHIMRLGLPEDLMMVMIQGLVGAGPAAEFFIYLKDTALLPDPNDLIKGKAKLKKEKGAGGRSYTYLEVKGEKDVQLEASQLFAVACSIATAVKDKDDLEAFFDCLDNFATDEYGVVAVNELRDRLPSMSRTPQFSKWAERTGDSLIR